MNRQVWGHRGCKGPGYPPENSLEAFKTAIDCGAGGIELDVRLSADGELIVFHDRSLRRMTGTFGEIADFRLAELKKLRLLTTDGRSSGESVPTLNEVLDLVDRQRAAESFTVNIELKGAHCAPAVASALSRCLAQGWRAENFLISSFAIESLKEISSRLPDLPIGVLFECSANELPQEIAEITSLRVKTINIPFSSLTPAVLSLIHAGGAKAVVWKPNEINPNLLTQAEREQLSRRLREREFVMITDFPKELLHLLKPNRALAAATGFLAAYVAYGERNFLFQPSEAGLENLKAPSEYPELKRFGFKELELIAQDGIAFSVWERQGALDRPHYLLFHGSRGHWGDTGPGDSQRDRKARLKFIEELAASGGGVTAVSLRGFGEKQRYSLRGGLSA